MKNNFQEPVCALGPVGFVQRHKKLIIFAMRVSLLNMILLLTATLMLKATPGTGQNIDEINITLEAKNESLRDILKQIEDKTHLRITYLSKHVDPYANINLPLAERTVKETLDLLLKGTDLTYNQLNNYVFVEKGGDIREGLNDLNLTSSLKKGAVLLFTVTGTVTDAQTKEPMAGVNIVVKGTTNGTTTDAKGKFAVDANDEDVLVFSFIGFKTFETQVGGRTVIEVTLEEDVEALKEVVINAGYWSLKENEKTGNIVKVSSTEIEKQPISNPLQALQGRMAGVYIQQSTGVPGGGFKIQIRGKNSLRRTGNDALYVVDGVPFTSTSLVGGAGSIIIPEGNPLNNINPSDIESIEVLKDADATAIYGSRGANGVVLITTKKNRGQKTSVDVTFSSGFNEVSKFVDLLDAKQWLEMRKEAFKNDGVTPTKSNAPDLVLWDTTKSIDWQRKLIGNRGNITNAQVSISGSKENTSFLFGGGFYKEGLVFPGDLGDQKISGHLNLNHSTDNQRFRISFLSNYLVDNNKLLYSDLSNIAMKLSPVSPDIYDDNGNLNWENGLWTGGINPIAYLSQTYHSVTKNFISNATLSFEVLPGLRLKSSLGYNSISTLGTALFPKSASNPANNPTGVSIFSSSSVDTWIIEPQIEFDKVISNGRVMVLLGSTFQQNDNQSQSTLASGFSSDALLENILAAPTILILEADSRQYRYNGVFARINYNWKEKYLINLTGRRDGSSRFGPGKRFANFGAAGVAWIFTNENWFLSNQTFINYGKLRGSYGITGSDQIGDYGYLETYSPTGNSYQGQTALYPTNLVNPDFAWEVNKKLEAAIEMEFFKNRLSISASWYRNRSSNQLEGLPLPQITGFNNIPFNLPATIDNWGWEFDLRSTNLRSTSFQWTTSLNLTVPRNRLIEYPNIESSGQMDTYAVGESLFVKKKLHYTGVDPQTGVYTFLDISGDGNISSSDDRIFRKEILQDFFGGINNSITYKGIQLDIFFQFVKQTGENYFLSFPSAPGRRLSNQPTLVMDRWQDPGDISDVQKFSQATGPARDAFSKNTSDSDHVIGDASFIRLKNVSISYTLPKNLNEKLRMQRSMVFIRCQNLLTVTDYVGDPETQRSTVLPPLRTVLVGTQITF